jgi:hypothetical protein
MAATNDDEQPPPPAPAPSGTTDLSPILTGLLSAYTDPSSALRAYQQSMASQSDQTPVNRSWTSLLGSALGGGSSGMVNLTPAQREMEGNRQLLNLGVSMLMNSGPSPVRHGLGQIIGGGLQAAGEAGQSYEDRINAYQQQQMKNAMDLQQMRINALKEALPFLQLNMRQNMPSLYGGGQGTPGGGPVAGAATGAPIPSIARDPSMTAGQQANNPGNLMAPSGVAFPGMTGTIPVAGGRQVAAFPDVPTGIAAMSDNLTAYQAQHGINTIRGAVARWVSDPKADLTSYTNDVAKAAGVDPDAPVNLSDPKIQQAFFMAQQPHESGKAWLQPGDVAKGIAMAAARRAGGQPPAAPGTATAAATPPAATPGVQMGGPAPAPPGAAPGAPAGPGSIGGVFAAQGIPAAPAPAGLPRDQAAALAKTTGRPVPILNGNGAVMTPDGTISLPPSPGFGRKTADTISRGMTTAQQTPLIPGQIGGASAGPAGRPATLATAAAPLGSAQPAPPGTYGGPPGTYGGPPGTAPPAAVPPPAAPAAQPASQPPAPALAPKPISQTAPVRDLSTIKPTDMTLPEWQRYYRTTPTPDELVQRGIVLPADAPEFRDAQSALQEAEANAARTRAAAQNAVNQAQVGITVPQDQIARLMQASNDADKNAQAARDKYNGLLHDTTKTDAKGLADFYQQQDDRNATDYDNQVVKPRAAAIQAGVDLKKDQIGLANHTWSGYVDSANAKAGAARQVRDQLEPAMGMVGNQPTSVFIRSLIDNDPHAASYLKSLGITDPDQVDAQTSLRGILSYVSSEMKPTGTGALREYEMNAIRNSLGTGTMGLDNQRLALARILNLHDRIINEADAAGELWGNAQESGNPTKGLGTFQKDLDTKLGPVVHDATKEMSPADLADPAQVGKWVTSGVVAPHRPVIVPTYGQDGQLVRNQNGTIKTQMRVVE